MGDGSKKKLWCTFGPQQIDINPFSKPGKPSQVQASPAQPSPGLPSFIGASMTWYHAGVHDHIVGSRSSHV